MLLHVFKEKFHLIRKCIYTECPATSNERRYVGNYNIALENKCS